MRQEYWNLKLSLLIAVAIIPTTSLASETRQGTASWFSTESCVFNPDPRCPTASGQSLYELERRGVAFGAMWDVPLGSTVLVCYDETATCLPIVILDRGPNTRLGRLIDLDKESFRLLSGNRLDRGLIPVTVKEMP